ncbi:MAG: hypothetical protein MN733_11030 [Nitrososphaera sp.]|nr:hypothetical protein [Nitrososphaera sp.]
MPLEDDYQRVARRSLDASAAALNARIQEKSAFLSYHAFESTGCALSVVAGLPVGPRVGHNDKIRNFTIAARRRGHGDTVAGVAVSLAGIRNSLLYPVQDLAMGIVRRPEDAITEAQARRLNARVRGVVNWVDTQI